MMLEMRPSVKVGRAGDGDCLVSEQEFMTSCEALVSMRSLRPWRQ